MSGAASVPEAGAGIAGDIGAASVPVASPDGAVPLWPMSPLLTAAASAFVSHQFRKAAALHHRSAHGCASAHVGFEDWAKIDTEIYDPASISKSMKGSANCSRAETGVGPAWLGRRRPLRGRCCGAADAGVVWMGRPFVAISECAS